MPLMRYRRLFLLIVAGVFLASCNRDPQVAKKKYLENGNRYFARGKYKEASIMYRNAIQKDPKFGEAYYRLAVTEWQLGRMSNTMRPLERAISLLDKNLPEYSDANLKLAEVYQMAAAEAPNPTAQNQLMAEVERISGEFLKRDPNSYEGHKLAGDTALFRATNNTEGQTTENAKQKLETAVREYNSAIAIRPQELPVKLSLARTLVHLRRNEEAEKLYQFIVEQDKTAIIGYAELYRLYTLQNRRSDAEAVLKRAIVNNPKESRFAPMLAAHYYAVQRPDDMVKVLNGIKAQSKENDRVYLTVGDFYLKIHNYDEAIRQYR